MKYLKLETKYSEFNKSEMTVSKLGANIKKSLNFEIKDAKGFEVEVSLNETELIKLRDFINESLSS